MTSSTQPRYLIVLGTAVLCYAALGIVLGILPDYVHSLGGDAVIVGLAVGAPAITAAGRPLAGRVADHRGPARIVVAGALVMAVGTLPAFVVVPLLLVSRLVVGAGEAAMMAATVLWLLRLAGPERRGRAMGHVGLANYGGLRPSARCWRRRCPVRTTSRGYGSRRRSCRWWRPGAPPCLGRSPDRGVVPEPAADEQEPDSDEQCSTLRATLRPGLGLMLVNFGYVAVLSFGAAAATEQGTGIGSLVIPMFGVGVIASRTILAGIPDCFGAPRTLSVAVAPRVGRAGWDGRHHEHAGCGVRARGDGDRAGTRGSVARTAGAGIGAAEPARPHRGGVLRRLRPRRRARRADRRSRSRAADPTGGLIAAAGAVLATAPVALLTRSRMRTSLRQAERQALTLSTPRAAAVQAVVTSRRECSRKRDRRGGGACQRVDVHAGVRTGVHGIMLTHADTPGAWRRGVRRSRAPPDSQAGGGQGSQRRPARRSRRGNRGPDLGRFAGRVSGQSRCLAAHSSIGTNGVAAATSANPSLPAFGSHCEQDARIPKIPAGSTGRCNTTDISLSSKGGVHESETMEVVIGPAGRYVAFDRKSVLHPPLETTPLLGVA